MVIRKIFPTAKRGRVVAAIVLFACIGLIIILYACSSNTSAKPKLAAPPLNCPPRDVIQLNHANLGLEKSVAPPQVASLTFTPDGTHLLIAFAFDKPDQPGQLAQVDMGNNRLLRAASLDPLTPALTRFTEDAARLVSAAPKTCAKKISPDDICWDVYGWLTDSGQRMEMPEGSHRNLQDIAVSGDGRWLLRIMDVSSITGFDPQAGGESFGSGIDPEQGIVYRNATGALSKGSNLVALGIRTEKLSGQPFRGSVELEQWDSKALNPIIRSGLRLGSDDLTDPRGLEVKGMPLRLTFDSADRWLAAQTESAVYLFDVASFGAIRDQVDFLPTSLGVLRFNPFSSLLAGGHAEGLRVWSVPGLKTVLNQSSAQTTAIAFSPDGCLLAWGDVEGTVHIINAPKP